VARSPNAGRVRVAARREANTLVIQVSDDGPGFAVDAPLPAEHGLSNTRERLRALYGDTASLSFAAGPSGGTIATLRLPYHEAAFDVDDGR
jgi:signal transduction histidine kinase